MRWSDEVCFGSVDAGGLRLLWERRSCVAIERRHSVARAVPVAVDMTATLVPGSDV